MIFLFTDFLRFPVFQIQNGKYIGVSSDSFLQVKHIWKQPSWCSFGCLYLMQIKCSKIQKCPEPAGLSSCRSQLYSHEGLTVSLGVTHIHNILHEQILDIEGPQAGKKVSPVQVCIRMDKNTQLYEWILREYCSLFVKPLTLCCSQ